MKIDINNSSDGQYYFVIKGANGQSLCHSETYMAKQSAQNAIEAIMKNAATATIVDNT